MIKPALASALLLSFFVIGCGPARPVEDVSKVRNTKHAVKLLNEVNAGVTTTTFAGDESGARNSGFNTKFFNMAFSSTKVDVPLAVRVDLGNSPAAQKLKSEGATVYTYIRPRFELSITNNKQKRDYKKSRRFNLPSTSLCDGYYVILHPGNNYSRRWALTESVEIREKTSGIDGGVWGKSLGSSDWFATEISEANATRSFVQLTPFRKDIGRSLTKTCYPDDATRKAWNR